MNDMERLDLSKIENWDLKFRPMFGVVIKELVKKNKDIILVVADSARAARIDGFEENPSQLVDVGIAEQNMMGVCSGLAHAGLKPIAFAFSPFATERCFEQLRLDVAYSGTNVVVVGSEGGFGLGTQGVTHYGWDDYGAVSSLPGIRILCPSDHISMIKLLERALDTEGPFYVRLNGGTPGIIYPKDESFDEGLSKIHKKGKDVNILTAGPILSNAMEASKILEKEGISVGVADMFSIKPVDDQVVKELGSASRHIVTVEEHSICNGLGSAVAVIMAENACSAKLTRIGLPDKYPHTVSPYNDMIKEYGLDAQSLADKVRSLL